MYCSLSHHHCHMDMWSLSQADAMAVDSSGQLALLAGLVLVGYRLSDDKIVQAICCVKQCKWLCKVHFISWVSDTYYLKTSFRKRALAIVDLNTPTENVKKISRVNNWKISAAQWNPHPSLAHYFVTAVCWRIFVLCHSQLLLWTSCFVNKVKGY